MHAWLFFVLYDKKQGGLLSLNQNLPINIFFKAKGRKDKKSFKSAQIFSERFNQLFMLDQRGGKLQRSTALSQHVGMEVGTNKKLTG